MMLLFNFYSNFILYVYDLPTYLCLVLSSYVHIWSCFCVIAIPVHICIYDHASTWFDPSSYIYIWSLSVLLPCFITSFIYVTALFKSQSHMCSMIMSLPYFTSSFIYEYIIHDYAGALSQFHFHIYIYDYCLTSFPILMLCV